MARHIVARTSDIPPGGNKVVGVEGRDIVVGSLSRNAFYERARNAFAIVATGEPRAYGCFLLVKGVTYANGAN